MRGKNNGSRNKGLQRPVPDDTLPMEALDTVVGGAGAVAPLKPDDDLMLHAGGVAPFEPPQTGGGLTIEITPVHTVEAPAIALPAEPTQMLAADAATQLASGKIDAAHAVANVEAYAQSHNTSVIGGLTDLLDKSHDTKVAAALSAELHDGTTEANLARLIKSGKMNADDAIEALKHATDSLAKFAPDGHTPTDGLFEMSVAHLYRAAGEEGNTELQNWINTTHNFDLKSGMVEIAADQASNDLEAGRITIDSAIKLTTDEAARQGLPQDIALTALLVDTHGNVKAADALANHLNGAAPLTPNALSNDLSTAINARTLNSEQAVEVIREAVDALTRYAPAKVEGTADMNFAEALVTLKYGAAANNADLQTYLAEHHSFEIRLGTVLQQVEYGLTTSPNHSLAEAIRLGNYYCWQQGMPTTVINMALVSDSKGEAGVSASLANQLNNGSWGVPSAFGQELMILMTQDRQDPLTGKTAPRWDLHDAIDLIKNAVDVLDKYAPNQIQGSAHMSVCEVIAGLVTGNGANAVYTQQLRKEFGYEIKLGEVALAAEYGITYANTGYKNYAPYHPEGVGAGEYNALYWTKQHGVPDVFAYISVLGDVRAGSQGGTALCAQHLSDGLTNGSLEKNVATLVSQGKISAEQGAAALLEAVNTLARYNKIPANMTADTLKAYALDTLRDEAELLPNKGGAGLVSYLQSNYESKLRIGESIDRVLTATPAAYAQSAAGLATMATIGSMQRDLSNGQSTILDLMTKNNMPLAQAESALIQMAGAGQVPLEVIGEQLNLLITNKGLNPTQLMTDIGNAAGAASGMPVTSAVVLLSEMGSRSPAMQQLADAAIDGFVASGKITPAALIDCLHSAVVGHALSDAQALATLTAAAGSTNTQLSSLASREMGSLVQHGHVDATAAIGAIHNAAAAGLIAATAAVPILVTLATNGNAAVQTAAGAELAVIAPGTFAAAIHTAVMKSSMTADAALAVLAGAGGSTNIVAQNAANAEIAALVQAGRTTADHAIIVLTQVAVDANQATHDAVGREIAVMVGAKLLTAQHAVEVMMGMAVGATSAMQHTVGDGISALVTAKVMTADDVMRAMSGMAPTASPAMLTAIGTEMAALYSHKQMTINQFWGDVWNSALQPPNSTKFWTVLSAMMNEAGPDLLPTLQAHSQNIMRMEPTMPATAMAAIDAAVNAKAMTGVQAAEALAHMIAGFGGNATNPYDNAAKQAMSAISGEFANLVAHNQILPGHVMHEVSLVVTAGTPSIALLMVVAGGNAALQAGVGEEIANHAREKSLTATQVANLITQSNITDPAARLCMWAGIDAGAPIGEIRDLADRNITAMVVPEQVRTSWGYQQGYPQIGAAEAIRILVALGNGNDANLRDVALTEIADLVQAPTNLNQGSLPLDTALTLLEQMAARGDAKMQEFVGAELAAIAANGAPLTAIMDHVVQATNSGKLTGDQALALFAAAGENGTGALRNAAAVAIQQLADYGRISGTQLNTFMSNHLYDGMTESILVNRMKSGQFQPADVMPTLNGLVDTFIRNHPGTSKSEATAITLASLEIAVNAAVRTNPIVPEENYWWSGNSNETNRAAQRVLDLQNIMHKSSDTMAQVLTGLGMLQTHQQSREGVTDVLLTSRAALAAYVTAETNAGGTGAVHNGEADKKRAEAAAEKGTDLLGAARDALIAMGHNKDTSYTKPGLLGLALENPRSYEAWAALGGNVAGGPLAGQVTGAIATVATGSTHGGLIFTAVALGSKGLEVMFAQSAVESALGANNAALLGSSCGVIASSCDFLSAVVGGVTQTTTVAAVNMMVNTGMFIDDLVHNRDATQSATRMYAAGATLGTGVTYQSAEDAYGHGKGAWNDMLALRDPRDNLNALKQDIDDMFGAKNAYVVGATNAYNSATNAVVKAANALASAGTVTGNAIANFGTSAGNTIAGTAVSVGNSIRNFFGF